MPAFQFEPVASILIWLIVEVERYNPTCRITVPEPLASLLVEIKEVLYVDPAYKNMSIVVNDHMPDAVVKFPSKLMPFVLRWLEADVPFPCK